MEAKYKNLKEKFNEYVDDLRNEMGVPINKPRTKDEWKPL
jgi:3-deoxy-D-arabino-heptulosonate 7-phosphate (DAHP) synthase